jgi:surfeit locus 1 family protein
MTLSSLLVLLALGGWQLQRLHWKTGLIEFREARIEAPPVPMPTDPTLTGSDGETLEFRRVTVTGRFLNDREIYLAVLRLGKSAFDVITPLRRDDGTTVLVDRGWVPAAARAPARRAAGQIAGPTTVEGLARAGGRRGWFTPDNDPERNYWFWLDIPAMAAFAGVEAPPLVIEAGPAANPGGLPLGRDYRVDLPNDHLYYAVTWFSLAAALGVIYVLSQWRAPPKEEQ